MKEIKETCYKGTRILLGNEKRILINNMIEILLKNNFIEISIPVIQSQEMFKNKVGEENSNMMYNFKDKGDRDICLAPEYTAIVQKLSQTTFKLEKDVKIFYVQECFRGEKPQMGRYRQFTQLGVEILNPTKDYNHFLQDLADCFQLKEQEDPDMWFDFDGNREYTGLDCAKYFKSVYDENNLKYPMLFVHSMNPIGTQKIINLFK